MIATLKESKAKLSAMVERAAQGEEVIITVRGQPKARLCPIAPQPHDAGVDRAEWSRRLREDRARYSIGTHDSSAIIVDELRGDRS